MQQQFNGTAQGQFSSRNIINIYPPISLFEKKNSDEGLLPAQQRRLHELLNEIAAISGGSKKDLWLDVHAHTDVRSLSEITVKKYHRAEVFLQKKLKEVQNTRECRRLISEILRTTSENINITERDRDRYCLKMYGTSVLKNLSRGQLQKVFRYVDSDQQQQVQTIQLVQQKISWQTLIKKHPVFFFCTLLLGFCLSFLFK